MYMGGAGMRAKYGTLGLGVALLAALLALASCGQPLPFVQLTPLVHSPLPPPAPASLYALTVNDGHILADGAWTNSDQVELGARFDSDPKNPSRLEVEFVPQEQPLVGVPTIEGQPGQTSVRVANMLSGKTYHWQARVRPNRGQPSFWTEYAGTFGYEAGPLDPPTIQPQGQNGWVGSRQLTLTWSTPGDPSGIAGYADSIDQSPAGALPARIDTSKSSATVTVPTDGDWYFHVRWLDGAGNVSPVATLPLHVDSVPLTLAQPRPDADTSWNPSLGPLTITVKASKAAQLSLAVLPAASDTAVRVWGLGQQQTASVQWDGKDDQGQALPPGAYRFRVDAADNAGRTAQVITTDPLLLSNKRIVVSLSQQRLVAYQGDKPVFDTLVTTGGPELPTPVGTFHVLQKLSPFTFHSPWPKGSPFWYPDSPTSYAMLFESSGYFIHDAPWRSWFGPGSNATAGQPGGNGTGTHGCVNVPLGVQAPLFRWTDVGTPVIIQN
jgi:lipoprotein-anchoring transpeptidase ErfK/SrfK